MPETVCPSALTAPKERGAEGRPAASPLHLFSLTQRRGTRRTLTIEDLARFEQSKRRKRHPAALRADVQREQARVKATSTPYREAEDAGQLALFDQGEARSGHVAARDEA